MPAAAAPEAAVALAAREAMEVAVEATETRWEVTEAVVARLPEAQEGNRAAGSTAGFQAEAVAREAVTTVAGKVAAAKAAKAKVVTRAAEAAMAEVTVAGLMVAVMRATILFCFGSNKL